MVLWIPAFAGMTGMWAGMTVHPHPSATGIPCDLASLARVPLRFAKGRGQCCLSGFSEVLEKGCWSELRCNPHTARCF